jgi:hypothetical protein
MRARLIGAAAAISALAVASGAVAHDHHHRYYHRHFHYAPYAVSAEDVGAPASARVPYGGPDLITSAPVPDTVQNRERYGGPMSYSGARTAPVGD